MATDKPRVGFIGLGLMGHGMAKNLVNKGFPLTVRVHRNRKPAEDILAAGAREARTNADWRRPPTSLSSVSPARRRSRRSSMAKTAF